MMRAVTSPAHDGWTARTTTSTPRVRAALARDIRTSTRDARPARRCSTRWPAAGCSTSRPGGCARRARASTRSARPATSRTRWSPRRCGRPTRRCCTTAPAGSSSARAAGRPPAARRAARRPARQRRRGRRPRLGRPAQGVGRRRRSRSSRRRRRSPRTCRARSGSPSRSDGRAGSGVADALAARRGGRVQLRRRLAEPLDRGRRAEHGRVLRHAGAADAAACWSARTTGSASRCRPRPAGSRRAAQRPGITYLVRRRATTRTAVRRGRAEAARDRPRAASVRRCCTCARCASSATPAPTSSPGTAPPPTIAADRARDPLLALGALDRRRRPASRATTRSPRDVAALADEVAAEPQAAPAARGDRAARTAAASRRRSPPATCAPGLRRPAARARRA